MDNKPWFKQTSTWVGVLGVITACVQVLPDYKAAVICFLSGVAGVIGGTNTNVFPKKKA